MRRTLASKRDADTKDTVSRELYATFEQSLPDQHDDLSQSTESDHDDEIVEKYGGFEVGKEAQRFAQAYIYTRSSASCSLDKIQGIIYGGMSSRFWLFRKHMCCLDEFTLQNDTKFKDQRVGKFKKRSKLPFYNWQCITLIYTHRQVDLVIKNEKSMDLLIRFLIWTLNTLDGHRNTAERKVNMAYDSEFSRVQKRFRKSIKGLGRFNEKEYNINAKLKSKILDH